MGKSEESVLVIVRCRPLNAKEIEQELEESGLRSTKSEDNHESHTSTPNSTGANAFVGGCVNMFPKVGLVEIRHPKIAATDPPKSFTFDYVYDWNSQQAKLYEETFAPLVNSVLQGFNGTIFAYGQTGAGKTFTMEGVRDDPVQMGVIPRTFLHIFDDHISNAPKEEKYLVTASYLEIYQEEIRDLLSKDHLTKRLDLRERPDTGVYVKDLTSFVCKSRSEIEHVMNVGNANRTVGATNMNEHSSRSHAIFIITIECSCPTEQNESHIRVGKLNLVDLAGSERQSKTGATGDRLKEATKINLSLSALGNVISALVDAKTTHIPYRDSKLTRLLQDSLGGNAKTVMIANIGPACFNYDETLTTLRYANRAKNIKNKPRINEDPKDALLREFQEEIARLKAQLSNRASSATGNEKKRKKSSKKHSSDEQADTSEIDVSADNSSGTDVSQVNSPEPPSAPENLESRLAIERELLENDTTMLSAEKQKLLQELASKELRLRQEKKEQDSLQSKIKALESKLISGSGTVNMVERTNEQQRLLEKRRADLADRRRAQQEIVQQLEAQEELGEELEKSYSAYQHDVEQKTRKLRKLFTKLQAVKQEINDVTEEFNRDRRDLEDTQQQLYKELKLKILIIDNFIPPSEKMKLLSRTVYDDEDDNWKFSVNVDSVMGKSAITKRPVSAAGSRRPISDYARMMSASSSSSASSDTGYAGNIYGLGGIRYRGENIMRLSLDRGGRTTRDYEGPQVAPRVQAALDAAMHNVEPDIEVDVSALNAKVGQAPVKGLRKRVHQDKPKKKNCWKEQSPSNPKGEAYPSSRGLVPK